MFFKPVDKRAYGRAGLLEVLCNGGNIVPTLVSLPDTSSFGRRKLCTASFAYPTHGKLRTRN